MMRVFITGDQGKIGELARGLLEQAGHETIGYDIARDSEQSILNPSRLKRDMAGCEVVVHCAAIPRPRHGRLGHYFDTNVQGTKFVMEMASQVHARRVVYISSTGYYGCDVKGGKILPLYLPIDEGHPPGLAHLIHGQMDSYDVSKMMAEQLVAYYGTNHLMETITLRVAPANPKDWQYRAGFDWQADDSWKRGCLFSNCHPDYAAQAIKLAVEVAGSFWYEPFNIIDQYTHDSIDVFEFARQFYPGVPVSRGLKEHDSLITPRKAMDTLGFEPCEDLN